MKTAYANPNGLAGISLSRGQWKLLWTIASYIDPETGIARVSTGELSGTLGPTPANLSAEMRVLIDKGIITRIRQGVLQVNPDLIYRDTTNLTKD